MSYHDRREELTEKSVLPEQHHKELNPPTGFNQGRVLWPNFQLKLVVDLLLMLGSNMIVPTVLRRKSLDLETSLDYLEAPFRSSSPPVKSGRSSCDHDSSLKLLTQDDGKPAGCGLCWLISLWESEVPGRIHAYKLLADNGKPQVAPAFWSHVEASLGLVRPKPGQNLKEFRLARGQIYRAPSQKQYPLLRALWNSMGVQPLLTTALVRSLQGRDLLEIAVELSVTAYGASEAVAKGTRLVLREFRSNGR